MTVEKNNENFDTLKSTAHDLNNIFTSILNSVELLKLKHSDDNSSQLIRNIENNSLRASEIINSLLMSNKDKKQLRTQFSISKLFNDLELTLKKSSAGEIDLVTNIDDKTSDVNGNYSELFRVFLNLCVNAKEASEKSGKIIISATNFDSTNSNIPQKLNVKRWVLFQIIDNGKGISEENLPKIFEEDFSTKKGEKISGIGLSIVKNIIDDHKGLIEVESKIGEGTNFKIYLPALPKADKTKSNPYSNSILIAEDSKQIAQELSELLKFEHYVTTIAYSGEEVLDLLDKGNEYDLFIIDKKMKSIDGIELIERIRARKIMVPIILASGSIHLDDEKRLSKLRINKYLKKPYLFESLVKNIRDLI